MRALTFSVFTLLVSSIFSGCTNNRFLGFLGSSNTSGNPLDNVTIPVTESAITLSRVVKNTAAPTSTFDLIGDGSGAMGNHCKGTTNTNTGPSACTCSYSYTLPDGSTQNYEAPTTYHEANLLRCLYVDIPAAAKSIKVRVHVTSGLDAYSNEFAVNFGGKDVTLDPTDASTYVLAHRYQCRDSVTIENSLSPNIYDPFQSEDLHNSYLLNFYTSNLGAAFSIHGGGMSGVTPLTSWHCPSIPNDPEMKMDLTVYSVAADSAGSKKIYPPTGSIFDRSTFYLARKATSVFNVPVNSYVAPGINSSSPDSQGNQAGVPPMGYGASPIPKGIAGQETCPDSSISIPSGYHWVKVWLFRMAFSPRKKLYSTYFNSMGAIACSPGDWSLASRKTTESLLYLNSVFPDCYNHASEGSRNSESLYLTDLTLPDVIASNAQLVSRVFEQYNACFNIDPYWHPSFSSPLTNSSYSTISNPIANAGKYAGPGRATASFFSDLGLGSGTDIWNQNMKYTATGVSPVDPNLGCTGTAKSNPAHLCTGIDRHTSSTPAPPSPAPRAYYPVPYDDAPVARDMDNPNQPQYDFLFVVSPPTVMSGEMTNLSSSVHNIYTPYRFMSYGDCISPDPDVPLTPGDCNPERALRNYGIKFHDVSGVGDPPGDDPNRAGVFPVCALQPD